MASIVSSVEPVCRSCPLSARLQNMRTISIANFRKRVQWTVCLLKLVDRHQEHAHNYSKTAIQEQRWNCEKKIIRNIITMMDKIIVNYKIWNKTRVISFNVNIRTTVLTEAWRHTSMMLRITMYEHNLKKTSTHTVDAVIADRDKIFIFRVWTQCIVENILTETAVSFSVTKPPDFITLSKPSASCFGQTFWWIVVSTPFAAEPNFCTVNVDDLTSQLTCV